MALTPSNMLPLGTPLPEFELLDTTTGEFFSTQKLGRGPVVVAFICNHCPFVKHIKPALPELGSYCRERGVTFVAVSSNDPATHPDDGPAAMAGDAKAQGYTFPYLFDEEQTVARDFDAACTPEFYLFDAEHHLVYRGQMDDARPNNAYPADAHDLKAAIEATIAGRAPSAEQKPSIGCNIKWKSGRAPSARG